MTDDILELEELTNENRRQFKRRTANIEILFENETVSGRGTSRDIGVGGLYLAAKTELPVGASLRLQMAIDERNLVLDGVVTYCDPGVGVGVRFRDLAPEVENILKCEMFVR